MIWRLLSAAFALVLVVGAARAEVHQVAWFPGLLGTAAPVFGACPMGTGLGDRCEGSAGLIQYPNLLSANRLSGQTYGGGLCPATAPSGLALTDCHPDWNVTGIERGVGQTTPTGAHIDPATLATGAASAGTLPTGGTMIPSMPGCAFYNPISNTTWSWSAQLPQAAAMIACDPRQMSAGATTNVAHLNQSSVGGHGCTFIRLISGSGIGDATKTINIFDSYLDDDLTCTPAVSGTDGVIRSTNSPVLYNINISNNTFLGKGDDFYGGFTGTGGTFGTNVSGAYIFVYWIGGIAANLKFDDNFVSKWPGRVYSVGNASTVQGDFENCGNLIYDFDMRVVGHGEEGTVSNLNSFRECYNTIALSTVTAANLAGINVAQATDGQTTNYVRADHNVFLTNVVGGTPGTITITAQIDAAGDLEILSGGPVSFGMDIGQNVNMTLTKQLPNGHWRYDCGAQPYYAGSGCPIGTATLSVLNVNLADLGGYTLPMAIVNPKVTNLPASQAFQLLRGSYGGGSIDHNYVDTTGILNGNTFSISTSGSCATPIAVAGNIIMNGGAAANNPPSRAGSGC